MIFSRTKEPVVRLSVSLFLLLLFVWPALAAEPADPGEKAMEKAPASVLDRFTPEQQKKLLAGEAIYEAQMANEKSDSPSGAGKAFVLINAPVEECFEKFSDFEAHRLYFPRKTVSKVLEVREDGTVSVYKELDFKLKTIRYYIIYTIDPEAHRVDFDLDEARESDIKASQGYFHFIAVDKDTTLFDYGLVNTEVGVKVPGFIRRYLTSKDLPRVVTNFKNWLESGGTWKK
jgi:hypothetical protein